MTKRQWINLALIAGAVITVIGLVTGKFLFLFIWLPLGFLFRGKKDDQNE